MKTHPEPVASASRHRAGANTEAACTAPHAPATEWPETSAAAKGTVCLVTPTASSNASNTGWPMESETDDDESDPNRMCAVCANAPRWSRHGNCKRCVSCCCHRLARNLMRRKGADYVTRGTRRIKPEVEAWKTTAMRERYNTLRRLGATAEQATAGRVGARVFEAMASRLRAAGVVSRGGLGPVHGRHDPRLPPPSDQPVPLQPLNNRRVLNL
jgi:hypothetical protein